MSSLNITFICEYFRVDCETVILTLDKKLVNTLTTYLGLSFKMNNKAKAVCLL